MTLGVEPRPDRIETGRTWRDLPPQPPRVAPPVEPNDAVAFPAIEEPPNRWRAAAMIGFFALAIGLVIGAWSPWPDRGTDGTAPQAAESPTTLPDSIVPPPAAAAPPNTLLPEDLFGLDDFPGFSDFFGSNPDAFRRLAPAGLDLIELTTLPAGYLVRSTSYSSSANEATEEIRLLGPDGTVTVTATRRADAELAGGEPFAFGRTEGRLIRGDPIVFSWLAADGLLVTIEAPAAAELDLVQQLVSAVEVTP